MYSKQFNLTVFLTAVLLVFGSSAPFFGQAQIAQPDSGMGQYIDPAAGISADEAVALALENNGEIRALRNEVDASRSMIKQAGSRANPKLTAGAAEQVGGGDNNQMAEFMLPLELGGRGAARIAVATREFEAREFELANSERLLAAEVRLKFGESLAAVRKLEVIETTLAAATQGYELVKARVTDGKIAPLEQNVFLVEVNRLRSIRESAEGKVEGSLLELRNMLGKKPDDLLRLRGDFRNLIETVGDLNASTDNALRERPDLLGARTVELLAASRIEEAKSDGRLDARVKTGYQRMNSSFPLSGYDDHGTLRPIQDVFHFFTFGVEFDLPVRNRNQGAVEAATFEREAARRRIEFGELSVRRDVAAAFARYNRAAGSLSIFQTGVRDQANANLQVVWQTYELGAKSLLDYISEERRFLDVENELIDSQLETYAANVEILKATNAPALKKK